MKTIIAKTYVFYCEDVNCVGVGCEECPILHYSEFGKTGRGNSNCAIICEQELLQFLSKFDSISSIKLDILPTEKEKKENA